MTFAKYVLNRFFAVAAQNNKAYVELLFWKNVGAVREMTEGYDKDGLVLIGSYILVFVCCFVTIFCTMKSYKFFWFYHLDNYVREEKRPAWTEEEEEELRKLYEEYCHSEGLFASFLFYRSKTILLHNSEIYIPLFTVCLFSTRYCGNSAAVAKQ